MVILQLSSAPVSGGAVDIREPKRILEDGFSYQIPNRVCWEKITSNQIAYISVV